MTLIINAFHWVNESGFSFMVKIKGFVLFKSDFIKKLKTKRMKHEFPFILM